MSNKHTATYGKSLNLSFHRNCTNIRKEKLSPHYSLLQRRSTGAFLFAPLSGSLTVEAAIVLPIFLFFMIAVLQFGNAMEAAVKFGTALTETGKTMAAAAYMETYGGDVGKAPELAIGALSAAYAQNRVTERAGDTSAVKRINMLQSSFLEEDQTIDLVLSYQIRSPIAFIKLPVNFFLQRARVRAWTGRTVQGEGEETAGTGMEHDMVYVTATGTVYHENAVCTHLHLSIRPVDVSQLETLRNNSGEIYHACERCGGKAGGTVYITQEGNRYHTSLGCSGLKRTVQQITREEAQKLRPCSKCSRG